jgi:hypothetical protein
MSYSAHFTDYFFLHAFLTEQEQTAARMTEHVTVLGIRSKLTKTWIKDCMAHVEKGLKEGFESGVLGWDPAAIKWQWTKLDMDTLTSREDGKLDDLSVEEDFYQEWVFQLKDDRGREWAALVIRELGTR